MKVVLLNPPGRKPVRGLQMHTPNPPLGLAYIAAAARDAGHDVAIVDAVAEAPDRITEDPQQRDLLIQGLPPDELVARVPLDTAVVGITCMFSSHWLVAREIISLVRRHLPHATIVCGGEHMSALAGLVLQTSPTDVVVHGEGEETFVDLLARLATGEGLEGVHGITFRGVDGSPRTTPPRARKQQIDQLPWPAWDLLPIEVYISRQQMHGVNRGRAMPILATRGCPYQCTFCSSPQMWTTRWLARDPGLVLDEIEDYMRRYGATDFHFQDLTAIVRRDWILAFTTELQRRELAITWQLPSGTRSEAIDAEVARALFASGCRNMAYAPESGSDEVRRIVKKKVKIDAMLHSIQASLREGMSLSCFFVLGFPDDTDKTLQETYDLVGKLAKIGVHDVGVAKFSAYPGSELFNRLQQEGRIRLDDDYFLALDGYAAGRDAVSFCDAVNARALNRWHLRILASFYVRSIVYHPRRTARVAWRVLATGYEETRYAKMLRDVFHTRRGWRRHLKRSDGSNPLSTLP